MWVPCHPLLLFAVREVAGWWWCWFTECGGLGLLSVHDCAQEMVGEVSDHCLMFVSKRGWWSLTPPLLTYVGEQGWVECGCITSDRHWQERMVRCHVTSADLLLWARDVGGGMPDHLWVIFASERGWFWWGAGGVSSIGGCLPVVIASAACRRPTHDPPHKQLPVRLGARCVLSC